MSVYTIFTSVSGGSQLPGERGATCERNETILCIFILFIVCNIVRTINDVNFVNLRFFVCLDKWLAVGVCGF